MRSWGMNADGLFVHGSLREGGRDRRWLDRTHPEGTCRAWAPGRLFHLAESDEAALFPGPIPPALPPGLGWVTGEFVGFPDSADLEQALENLDALQGIPEERQIRALLPVLLEGGQVYKAWAWVHAPEALPRLEREAIELRDGDWTPYL
jgi:gamma-glutamylcyclotransferase (GGCT)/AIG2-like uncharacterized protein YtfP